jgi:hypothetical protein
MRTANMTQPATSFDEECTEVLASVWAASGQDQLDPSRDAACERLLRHIAQASRGAWPAVLGIPALRVS